MSKITQLTEDTTPTHDDLIETVTDPAGTPLSRKAKLSSLFFVLQQWVFGSDAGSTDTYVVTLSPAPAAYVTGMHYRFKANTANTGACTVNFNSLGAKTIKKAQGGITTDLADNDIRAGQWVDLVYDGVNMQMQSTLGNAPSGGTGGIGDVVGPASSIDSEIVLFNSTTGKLIKRASLSGLLKAISGVIGQVDVNDLSSPVYAADAGSTDAYAITLSPAPSSYQTGALYRFKANTANTGAATLNVNALGAKTIKKVAGGITTDLADNDIRVGQLVDVVYDGTNFQIQSTLGNAAAGGGTPGGSSGDFQYNNTGAFGGGPLTRADQRTVELSDGTAATNTAINLYGLKNGANYERLRIEYQTGGGGYYNIKTEKGGTGATRGMAFDVPSGGFIDHSVAGTLYWRITSAGELKAWDSSARFLAPGGTVSSPGVQFASFKGMYDPALADIGFTTSSTYRVRICDDGIMLGSVGGFLFSSTALGSGTTKDTGIHRHAAGVTELNDGTKGNSGVLLLRGRTFANLPASPVAGMEATVTDSNTATWGATIAGGGSNNVKARYNGTNWTVVGI